MRIALRADAGLEQGSGHIVRTLTLAREFEQSGHEVQILGAIRDVPWLTEFVESSGIRMCEVRANSLDLKIILNQNFDLLVVDSYEISADEITAAAQEIETLAIVDHQTRGISTQYLLDHNLGATEFPEETKGQQLIGPRFALVRKEIRKLRRSSSSQINKSEKPNILVMFGGTDPLNLSLIVSDMMKGLDADFDINFVAPQKNLDSIGRNLPENRARIHKLTPKIQNLLAKADVVFSAAGTSVLDLSCIGIPSIYISVAENQNSAIVEIARQRIGLTIERTQESIQVKKQILEALNTCAFDQQVREELFVNSQNLVDGNGAWRVVNSITSKFS